MGNSWDHSSNSWCFPWKCIIVHLHECSIVVTVWLIKVSIWWNYLHDLIICLILYNAEEGHLNSFTRFSYLHRYITSVGTVSQGCGTAQPEGCPFPWLFPKVTKPQMHCRSLPVRHILPVFSLVSSIHFVGGKQRYQSNIFGWSLSSPDSSGNNPTHILSSPRSSSKYLWICLDLPVWVPNGV